jgi:uncharacterized protein
LPDVFAQPPFGQELFSRLLALNNAHARELALETETSFAALLNRASFVRAEPDGLAMLIGFHQDCDYNNPNFHWLQKRFTRFNYIDRVVVSSAARGRGLARALYSAFEQDADTHNLERLVCEINAVPPNPASDSFHQALGFKPVGEQVLEDRGKTVRYWAKELNTT